MGDHIARNSLPAPRTMSAAEPRPADDVRTADLSDLTEAVERWAAQYGEHALCTVVPCQRPEVRHC